MNNQYIKLVMLGEGTFLSNLYNKQTGRVGKTSLTLRYCKSEFDDQQESTINASYLEKQVTLDNSQTVNLAIWDTAGQEKFNALAPMYYRDAVGAIIVYDITYKESFSRVNKWYHELKQFADKNIVICIAGNKADCDNMRQIPKQEAEQYAKDQGAFHFTTSAKSNLGVDELFKHLTNWKKGRKLLEEKQEEQDNFTTSQVPDRPSHKLKQNQKDKEIKKKEGGCC